MNVIAARNPGHIPLPLSLMASGAAQHDLPVAKKLLEDHLPLQQGQLFSDKAYTDTAWAKLLRKEHTVELLTPWKKHKGDILISGDTFSSLDSTLFASLLSAFSTGSTISPIFNPLLLSALVSTSFFISSVVLRRLSPS